MRLVRRSGELIEKITSFDSLRVAWLKASRGRRASRTTVQFRRSLNFNLAQTARELREGRYRWGAFYQFTIFDPKERIVSVPPFRDRVAQHALLNYCEPVFDRYQIDQSCACRRGKGQTRAIELARRYSGRFKYYLKLDVRKYFATIDHLILKTFLARLFKDERVLDAFSGAIDAFESQKKRGLPIGSLTSQFFANHFLAPFDHFVKEELRAIGYVRYMDDFILWADDRARLKSFGREIDGYMADKLKLTLKPRELNSTSSGLSFLGMRVFPHAVRLGGRARLRFVKKYQLLKELFETGRISEREYEARMRALIAYIESAESKSFRRRVFQL